jgi:homopolymeric O-antigen transport system ATP-binding protein
MSDIAIRCEDLGKRYRIGERERYKALRDVVTDGVASPFRKLRRAFSHNENGNGHGSNGGRESSSSLISSDASPGSDLPSAVRNSQSDTFWALRDVSFEVKRGEVVGIIGRNGAGKSTLLKILSRITAPTRGEVEIKGRVGSLLEVGTGFHPELTGRENIFLNGAILGMKRAEINRKFDEMVAFAEIEKFIDTPVKRYSSGMYVRLAFAVAAHLEPEILLVDEVLAVGDAQFQKKCLGKIGEVAREGRTVLFVSHNMAAMSSLTHRSIVIERGQVLVDGMTTEAIHAYLQFVTVNLRESLSGSGNHTSIKNVWLLDASDNPTNMYQPGSKLMFEIEFETSGKSGMSLETFLVDSSRIKIAHASLHQFHGLMLPTTPGRYRVKLNFDPLQLASGRYSLDVTTSIVNVTWDHYVEDAVWLDVPFSNPRGHSWDFRQTYGYGVLALPCSSNPTFKRVS